MKKNEFPDSISDSQSLIDQLIDRIENEPDREKRRELFLLKMELRDHINHLDLKKK